LQEKTPNPNPQPTCGLLLPELPVRLRGNTNSSLLETEEAGYIYRYQYNGVGEGVTWLSSRNYMVIDLAAGPTTYGPLMRQGGAATPDGIPSIKVGVRGGSHLTVVRRECVYSNRAFLRNHTIQSIGCFWCTGLL
jgi:hypothetical protein